MTMTAIMPTGVAGITRQLKNRYHDFLLFSLLDFASVGHFQLIRRGFPAAAIGDHLESELLAFGEIV